MNIETIIAMCIGLAGTLGGYVGGRKNTQLSSETVSLLSAQIDALKAQADQIPGLLTRIQVLEDLVTQRADVEALKITAGRIEVKLDDFLNRQA